MIKPAKHYEQKNTKQQKTSFFFNFPIARGKALL